MHLSNIFGVLVLRLALTSATDNSECQDGWYGFDCNSRVSDMCKDRIGDFKTGDCIECIDGRWQMGACTQQCSENCIDGLCNKYDGSCECKDGWMGSRCDTVCPEHCDTKCHPDGTCDKCLPGFFGDKCETACLDAHPKDGVCDKKTGRAAECEVGWWGAECSSNCTDHNCWKGVCNKFDGQCPKCEHGFWDTYCDKPCLTNCAPGACNQRSGACSVCANGFGGVNCDQKCPEHCNACRKADSITPCVKPWVDPDAPKPEEKPEENNENQVPSETTVNAFKLFRSPFHM